MEADTLAAMRTLVALILGSLPILAEDSDQVKRLQEAATAFSEIMAAPDQGIPLDLIERSRCIVIVPGLKKGAFVFGAQYGRGFLSCRSKTAAWSAPGSVRVEGAGARNLRRTLPSRRDLAAGPQRQ